MVIRTLKFGYTEFVQSTNVNCEVGRNAQRMYGPARGLDRRKQTRDCPHVQTAGVVNQTQATETRKF